VPDRFEFAGPQQLLRLLDAVMAIGSELTLADALRRITEVSAELVDAQYAALGVLDESRSRLAEFVTVGLDEAQIERIGARPEGHGILGLLILEPTPLRLPDLKATRQTVAASPTPIKNWLLASPPRLAWRSRTLVCTSKVAPLAFWTSASESLAICTTMSSNACLPPGCRCRLPHKW